MCTLQFHTRYIFPLFGQAFPARGIDAISLAGPDARFSQVGAVGGGEVEEGVCYCGGDGRGGVAEAGVEDGGEVLWCGGGGGVLI
jgi:hypothetical protein